MKRTTFWLAYPSTPKGGIDRILDEIEALGIGACLSIRIGQAGRIENGCDEKFVQRVIDRIGVDRTEIWWGSHPTTTDSETRLAIRYHWLGVRRFVVNAETAWKRAGADEIAAKYTAELRKHLPDSQVWHAPFAMMLSHGLGKDRFPYLGFAGLHGMFLQLYPNEFGGNRGYWHDRYQREVAAYLKANPSVAKQKIVAMGDLYGSAFGKSWGLTPAAVPWSDGHLTQHLELAERMGDPEIALYSIDAALSESERPVKGQASQSNPWGAVQAWAAKMRGEAVAEAEARKASYDEDALQCVDVRAVQACFDRSTHAVCGEDDDP